NAGRKNLATNGAHDSLPRFFGEVASAFRRRTIPGRTLKLQFPCAGHGCISISKRARGVFQGLESLVNGFWNGESALVQDRSQNLRIGSSQIADCFARCLAPRGM